MFFFKSFYFCHRHDWDYFFEHLSSWTKKKFSSNLFTVIAIQDCFLNIFLVIKVSAIVWMKLVFSEASLLFHLKSSYQFRKFISDQIKNLTCWSLDFLSTEIVWIERQKLVFFSSSSFGLHLFPNQTYPNQTYPNQTYPNQTYPNQTKPRKSNQFLGSSHQSTSFCL